MKRWFRGPWLWVVLFAIVILVVVDMVSKSDGSEQIDTSTMISDIQGGKVKDVTLVEGDQRIEATLDDGDQKVTSNYVAPQGDSVVKALEQAIEDGKTRQLQRPRCPSRACCGASSARSSRSC